jgi:hypothetical protein
VYLHCPNPATLAYDNASSLPRKARSPGLPTIATTCSLDIPGWSRDTASSVERETQPTSTAATTSCEYTLRITRFPSVLPYIVCDPYIGTLRDLGETTPRYTSYYRNGPLTPSFAAHCGHVIRPAMERQRGLVLVTRRLHRSRRIRGRTIRRADSLTPYPAAKVPTKLPRN